MRIIKFRAWDKDDKIMYYQDRPVQVEFLFWGRESFYAKVASEHEEYADNSKLVLMQFTGLRDKTGIEIYEGDILYNPHDSAGYYLVVWDNQGERFTLGYNDKYPLKHYRPDQWWEVVGNIHENPEIIRYGKHQEKVL